MVLPFRLRCLSWREERQNVVEKSDFVMTPNSAAWLLVINLLLLTPEAVVADLSQCIAVIVTTPLSRDIYNLFTKAPSSRSFVPFNDGHYQETPQTAACAKATLQRTHRGRTKHPFTPAWRTANSLFAFTSSWSQRSPRKGPQWLQ